MALKPTAKFVSNKLGAIVTQSGAALFVSCPNASEFDETRQEASIILSPEAYETFTADLNKLVKAYEGELVVDPTKMELPVKGSVDKEGNPTGEFIVKAKTAMIYPSKLYNAKGIAFNPAPGFSVPNRSKIKLSVSAELINTKVYKGLVLRLNAVQVISSTPWSGSNPFTTEDGDFDYHTDGFTPEASSDDDWTK